VVGPLEPFCDLAVVVLVAQAARHLAGHLTWRGLGQFAAVFTLVWIAWTNGSLHAASPRAHPTLSSAFRDDPRQRHRLGAWHRGALACPAE
jgi:hypothetical protein